MWTLAELGAPAKTWNPAERENHIKDVETRTTMFWLSNMCVHVSLTIFFEASKANLVVAEFINLSFLKNKGRKMNGSKTWFWDSRPLSDEMDFLRLMDWVRSGWGSVLKSSTTPTLTEKTMCEWGPPSTGDALKKKIIIWRVNTKLISQPFF